MSLFSGGGGGWEGAGGPLFFLGGGGVTIFFKVFLGEGHNFFKSIFIEKINYEYPAAAGAGFRFLLIVPLPSKKKCPEGRNKTISMNLDIRYCTRLEGGSNR